MGISGALGRGLLIGVLAASSGGTLADERGAGDREHPREPWWPFALGPRYGDVGEDLRGDPRVIRLPVGSFDTRAGAPEIPASLRLPEEAVRSRTSPWLVQLDGPVTEAKKEALRSRGVRFYAYFPSNAFVVKADDPGTLPGAPGVLWAGPFHPAYRIEPLLGRAPAPDPEAAASRRFGARAILFEAGDRERVVEALEAAGAEVDREATYDPAGWPDRVFFTATPDALLAAARLDSVRWVEEVSRAGRTMNAESKVVLQSGAVGLGTPFWDAGVDGGTQIVGVMDNGMDVDTILLSHTPADAGTPGAAHRKVAAYSAYGGGDLLSCGNYTHGTNTAQCAAGNRSDFGMNGDLEGIAKGARVVFQDLGEYGTFDCILGRISPPASLAAAYDEVRAKGGHLTNGSFSICSGYGSHALDVDQYAWDHRDFLAFFSAGNGGAGLACPATAKNVVAAGGHYQDPYQDEFYGSTGPAPDGRMGPTVLAPACDHAGGNPPPFDYDTSASLQSGDSGISGAPEAILKEGMCGTSFSSPYAMGAAALVRDYFEQGFHPLGFARESDAIPPSGALVKAALLASGEFLPNCGSFMQSTSACGQGMGRVHLGRSLAIAGDPRTPPGMLVVDRGATAGLSTGEVHEERIEVTDASRPLRAVVAWIDRPGSALVNDLGLVVLGPDGTPSRTYLGGNFAGEYSVSLAGGGDSADATNPFEAVFVDPAEIVPGTWTIRVEGTNVPDGDPGLGDTQPFALVASGGFATPGSVREVSGEGSASPLVVTASSGPTVGWRWEDMGPGASYNLYGGPLPGAGEAWSYGHGVLGPATCGLPAPSADVGDRLDGANRYYLVAMVRVGTEGSLGFDSAGAERPAATPACP